MRLYTPAVLLRYTAGYAHFIPAGLGKKTIKIKIPLTYYKNLYYSVLENSFYIGTHDRASLQKRRAFPPKPNVQVASAYSPTFRNANKFQTKSFVDHSVSK
ncbi:MAG: hypothetical protein LBT09_11880 [Planctomycetaceae bacterium]|nr:hypothetical protein [Planctomycetaceae bacterium]